MLGLTSAAQLSIVFNRTLCVQWNSLLPYASTNCPTSLLHLGLWRRERLTRDKLNQIADSNIRVISISGDKLLHENFRVKGVMIPVCKPSGPGTVFYIDFGAYDISSWNALRNCVPSEAIVITSKNDTPSRLPNRNVKYIGDTRISDNTFKMSRIWQAWCVIRNSRQVVHLSSPSFVHSARILGSTRGIHIANYCESDKEL